MSLENDHPELFEVLGRDLTKYIVQGGGEAEVRTAMIVLRAFRKAGEDDNTIRAWFIGMNPGLENNAPADVLAGQIPGFVAEDVLAAARVFAAVAVELSHSRCGYTATATLNGQKVELTCQLPVCHEPAGIHQMIIVFMSDGVIGVPANAHLTGDEI